MRARRARELLELASSSSIYQLVCGAAPVARRRLSEQPRDGGEGVFGPGVGRRCRGAAELALVSVGGLSHPERSWCDSFSGQDEAGEE